MLILFTIKREIIKKLKQNFLISFFLSPSKEKEKKRENEYIKK